MNYYRAEAVVVLERVPIQSESWIFVSCYCFWMVATLLSFGVLLFSIMVDCLKLKNLARFLSELCIEF